MLSTEQKLHIAAMLVLLLFLQGCAGVRNSYESLLDPNADKPLIILKVGEKREVLAIGNGFPGWWGYYPAIASHDPGVASVTCKKGRSLIPFREPGIVFGGERCYIEAYKIGTAWLLPWNKYSLHTILEETDFMKVLKETDYPPGDHEAWIKVKVVAAPVD